MLFKKNLLFFLFLQSSALSFLLHAEEVDTDNDGVFDSVDVDADGDGLIEISSLSEFNNIRNNLTGTAYNDGSGDDATGCGNNSDVLACFGYELTADLDFDENGNGDLSDDSYWNSGAGFEPLTGIATSTFNATFDGNGFSIKNLFIDMDSDSVGLFRQIRGATFRNFNLVDASVSGNSSSGILAGRDTYSDSHTFENISISGSLNGDSYVGGLDGNMSASATISDSNIEVDIVATNDRVAGYIGYAGQIVTINDSSIRGSISGRGYVAGFIGIADETYVYDSFADIELSADDDYVGAVIGDAQDIVTMERISIHGSIEGDRAVGGVIGEVSQASTFTDIAVMATVSGEDFSDTGSAKVGGIAGQLYADLTLSNVLVAGQLSSAVDADTTLGGLAGYSYSNTIIASSAYWDNEATGVTANLNNTGASYVTDDLKCPTSNTDATCNYTPFANWSNTIWDFGTDSEYPAIILNSDALRDSDNDGVLDNVDVDDDGNGLIEISTLAEFNNIRNNLAGTAYNDGNGDVSTGCGNNSDVLACFGYELTADIDFDENADGVENDTFNTGEGWTSIGDDGNRFTATFDGNGFTVSNLFINNTTATDEDDGMGLFGYAENTVIKNLSVTGNVSAESRTVAGIVAYLSGDSGSTLENLRFDGDITAPAQNSYAGGIAARIEDATINGCVAYVTIASGSEAGGAFGRAISSDIDSCLVQGEVTTTDGVAGGLIATLASATTVSNSFARADVVGTTVAGGLIGSTQDAASSVTNSYTTGSASGSYNNGGALGSGSGSLTNVYWDTEASGNATSVSGTGYTTSELQSVLSNTGIYASWGTNYWDFGTTEQYPTLMINGVTFRDTDGDGTFDSSDDFPNDPTEDTDSDNDGVGDNADAFPNDDSETSDLDNDGIGDNTDTDLDGDDVANDADFFPYDASGSTAADDVDVDDDGLIEISTLADLHAMRDDLAGNSLSGVTAGCAASEMGAGCIGYELTADLDFDTDSDGDLSDESYYNAGEGWQPIGSEDAPFTGNFDGNGFTISNVFINRPLEENQSLFGYVGSIDVSNINIAGDLTSVTGDDQSALLISRNSSSDTMTLTNINVSGSVVGVDDSGLVAGKFYDLVANQVHASGSITSYTSNLGEADEDEGSDVGGLFGQLSGDATLDFVSFNGSIIGVTSAGGLVGDAESITLNDSYAIVDMTLSDDVAGGLIGKIEGTNALSRVFAEGSVSGTTQIGGLIGNITDETSITDAYSAVSLTGVNTVGGIAGDLNGDTTFVNVLARGLITTTGGNESDGGGLIGFNESSTFTVDDAYWDTDATDQDDSFGDVGTAYNTTDLQCPQTTSDESCSSTPYDNSWSDTYWDYGSSSEYPALVFNSYVYRDSDNDGYWVFEDAFDNDASEYLDSDNDGVGDNADEFPNDSTESVDTDGDGIGNNSDSDDDGDGLTDVQETLYGFDSLDSSDVYVDSDGDSILDIDEILQGTDHTDATDFIAAINTEFNHGQALITDVTHGVQDDFTFGAIVPDGNKFLFSGYYYYEDDVYDDDFLLVVRVNNDGTLDSTFGDEGIYYGHYDDQDGDAQFLTKTSDDGYLVSATYNDNGAIILALTSDGEIDTSKFTDGIRTTPGFRGYMPVAIEASSGDYYIGGGFVDADGHGYVGKYDSAGELDATFAGDGTFNFDFNSGNGGEHLTHMFEKSTGNILVFFRVSGSLHAFELTTAGELNTDFGNNGYIEIGAFDDMVLLSDDRFAVLSDTNQDDLQLTVYASNGTLDTGFGAEGVFEYQSEGIEFEALNVFEQANGTLIIASNFESNALRGMQLVQVTSDGDLDTRLNGLGYSRAVFDEQTDFKGATQLDSHHIAFAGEHADNYYEATMGMMLNPYDHDLDGVPDSEDAFPEDANESVDSDNDGVGDQSDAFPYDSTEWLDSDNDGTGDNADAFPNDVNESVDSDNDGYGDQSDAFPYDSTEWLDSDNDGTGDNADAFPSDASESVDSDNDGYGDQSDAFPNDATEQYDTDGDGVGNNADTNDAGDLNTNFGLNGIASAYFTDGEAEQYVYDAVIHDNGLYLVGNSYNNTSGEDSAIVVDMNTDGSINTDFASTGILYERYNSEDTAFTNILYKNNAIWALGENDNRPFMAKYDTSGALDVSFNGSGYYADDDSLTSIGIEGSIQLSDGSLITHHQYLWENYLYKFTADGELDTSFGSAGVQSIGAGGLSNTYSISDIKVLSDDSLIVLVDPTSDPAFIAKIDANGVFDTNFGIEGYLELSDTLFNSSVKLAIDEHESVYAIGKQSTSKDTVNIVKVTDGEVDTSYGNNGYADFYLEEDNALWSVADVVIQRDGRMLVLTGMDEQALLIRLTDNGELDTQFNTIGYISIPVQDFDGTRLLLQDNGNVFIAGGDWNGLGLFVVDVLNDYDFDGDGLTNSNDLDDDNDGVDDALDAFPEDASETLDSDNDGVGDNTDELPFDDANTRDSDNDGVGDNTDAFPNDATETKDSDMDGVGDNADAFPNDANESIDSDNDGYGDQSDAFPYDSTEWLDSDNDGTGDNADAFPNDATESTDSDNDGTGDNADAFPNDANESIDSDNDGYGDQSDAFPYDSTEWLDSDNDGTGDNADAFPNDANESIDSDNDGYGDQSDAFPYDSTEWLDSDNDGVGDNADAFPNDANESIDSDNDGYGDQSDAFPYDSTEWLDSDNDGTGDNADAFPNDATETQDSDNDGTGDNADAFPNDATETLDSDNDGTGDNADAFPNDATETLDSDNDGTGDNADAFPNDATETLDSDNDGVGDNADAFPNDATETLDSDKDGTGDNADAFPNDATETLDSDNDGTGDNADAFPNDATETKDSDNDGVGDNADALPNDAAETQDSDMDGVGDNADAFPNDATETKDSDNDGVGDNTDAFPNDATETQDSDMDGVGDNADAFPNDATETKDSDMDGVGDNADAFPNDATETKDSDMDGVGDNADALPNDATETKDSDMDGVGDNADAFPNDATETKDSDNDGVGDNADAFPNDAAETKDSDMDGVGDNADAFPNDATETKDSDMDGVGDNADAFPNDPTETLDTDQDGIGNNEDTDDDGDGIPDEQDSNPLEPGQIDTAAPTITGIENITMEATGTFTDVEVTLPTISDDIDASPQLSVDTDSFAFSVGEHVIVWTATDASGNQSFAEQFITITDTTAPSFEQLENITINAQGRLTNVENYIDAFAVDIVDGEIVANVVGETRYESGRHIIELQATDNEGNIALTAIAVDIVPQLSVTSHYPVEAGGSYQISTYLSGEAASYPVQISYSLLINGFVNNQLVTQIEEGQSGGLSVEIPADISSTDALELQLDSSLNAFIGDSRQTLLNIIETNVAPRLSLRARQNDRFVSVIDPRNGLVTITATVHDINQSDSHDINWLPIDTDIVDEGIDNDELTFELDPSLLQAGVYTLRTSAIENNTNDAFSVSRRIQFVVAELPTLSEDIDTDNDGVSDADEGYGDSDGDGIADYLDNDDNNTRLPIDENTQPMQTQDGLVMSLGALVSRLGADVNASGITVDDLATIVEDGDANTQDDGYETSSPLYNFTIDGLSEQGESVAVVIPLTDGEYLPAQATYRKYSTSLGWYTFVEDANNRIASALMDESGNCPLANDAIYDEASSQGLVEGNNCIQLVIEDGGPNDADGEANGSIEDPGVITVEVDEQAPINNAPTVTIDSHLSSVLEGQTITLSATANDVDGDEITFDWIQLSGPTVIFENSQTSTISLTLPEVTEDSEVEVQVTVSDGEISQSIVTQFVIENEVVEEPDNQAPTVSIETHSQSVNEGDAITLLAIASDSDGDNLSYQWQQISGPVVSFDNTTVNQVELTMPSVTGDSQVEIQVTVSDGELSTSITTEFTIINDEEVIVVTPSPSSSSGGVMAWLMVLALMGGVYRRRYAD